MIESNRTRSCSTSDWFINWSKCRRLASDLRPSTEWLSRVWSDM